MRKNILLAYISDVSGHRSAAAAIEKALKLIEPEAQILSVNLFSYTNPYSEKFINHLYTLVIKKMPQIWEYLYDNPKVVKSTEYVKNIIHKFNSKKLKKLFDEFNPDIIVCTQAFPCGMFADFKKIYRYETPLVGVVTDFFPHSYWAYPNVDYYTVANEESKRRLIEQGIDPKRIMLLGIPIDPKFSFASDKARIAKKIGFDLSVPIILVMGGGQGLGPIKTIVRSLDSLKLDLQIIIATGSNIKLYGELRKMHFSKKHLILGYVNNINELMEVSSVIVTKPGGLTISEALAKSVIPVIVRPIPGQEENNTKFLLRNNAAFKIENSEEVPGIIKRLLSDSKQFTEVMENIKSIAKPRAALDVASLILKNA
ncbi:MAG: glycosyltransferase [Candidatus Omnitrophota bacterium]|nr:glycosyltransferase [Candidatus Omnitrophota bacterium]